MNFRALICARGGSKGIPDKNIRLLGNHPLIVHSINHARAVPRIENVAVSTDSAAIADIAKKAGASIPFLRPAELAQDNSPEWLVWRHALQFFKQKGAYPAALAVIPATAPLRTTEDIERCLDEFEKGNADVVITVTDARRSPYFNMVSVEPGGKTSLVIRPDKATFRRQDVPKVFDMTTVCYVVRPDFVMESSGIFDGIVKSIWVPPERALDIDTPLDFEIAEFLLSREKHSR